MAEAGVGAHSPALVVADDGERTQPRLLPDEADVDVERDQSGNRQETNVAVDGTDLESQEHHE